MRPNTMTQRIMTHNLCTDQQISTRSGFPVEMLVAMTVTLLMMRRWLVPLPMRERIHGRR